MNNTITDLSQFIKEATQDTNSDSYKQLLTALIDCPVSSLMELKRMADNAMYELLILKCPHCGVNAHIMAKVDPDYAAGAVPVFVDTEGDVVLGWDYGPGVDVCFNYLCQNCGEPVGWSREELQELYDNQQPEKQSTDAAAAE